MCSFRAVIMKLTLITSGLNGCASYLIYHVGTQALSYDEANTLSWRWSHIPIRLQGNPYVIGISMVSQSERASRSAIPPVLRTHRDTVYYVYQTELKPSITQNTVVPTQWQKILIGYQIFKKVYLWNSSTAVIQHLFYSVNLWGESWRSIPKGELDSWLLWSVCFDEVRLGESLKIAPQLIGPPVLQDLLNKWRIGFKMHWHTRVDMILCVIYLWVWRR